MTRSRWVRLAIYIGVAQAAGGIGSIFTARSLGAWYESLRKPSWNPPNWVFGPVWTLLFTLMGTAAWLVGERRPPSRRPLALWGTQLALNVGWSGLFFGLRSPGLALGGILALWAAIAATAASFWRVARPAGVLMLPYLSWVSFAAALNHAIWRRNPPRAAG